MVLSNYLRRKKFGVRFIIWSSVRSPENTRLQVWGEIIVDARVVTRNNTETALVHFAHSPHHGNVAKL